MTDSNRTHLFPPERLNCNCDDPVETPIMEFVVCGKCDGYLGMDGDVDG